MAKSGPKPLKRTLITKECLQCGGPIEFPRMFCPSIYKIYNYCSMNCRTESRKGKKLSIETRLKMSLSRQGRETWNKGIPLSPKHRQSVSASLRGEKHWNWKGGVSSENKAARQYFEYKQWRESIFKRDGFKCKISNADCVHEIHAHHILRFSEYPELRYDVSNGITLCKNHHPLKRSHEQELAPMFKKLIS